MATNSVASSSAGTLDVPSLVAQLMVNERKPIDNLTTKVSSYEAKISSFGTIKGLVSGFQTTLQGINTSLQGFSSNPSDASVFSASDGSTETSGIYSLNVTKLAQAHKLAAAGQTSDVSPIATTGPSTVTFNVGTTNTDITIAAGATLQDIRTAINAANMGVTATIVNDGSATPYRLALSSNNTGVSNSINSITIQAGGDSSINNLLAYNPSTNAPAPAPAIPMSQIVAAQDAAFTVNGIAISKASNTVTDAIEGVTLTLKNTTTTPATLTVARDTAAVSKAVAGFVDAYNALASQIKSRSAYGNATTPAGVLAGDGTLRFMQNQLRSIFNTAASGTLTRLTDVGVSFQADGTLGLDSSKLDSAMANNFSDVTNLFSSATGYTTRLGTWADSALSLSVGLIDTRTKNLNTSIQNYNDQISKLELRMTALQKQYTTTYTNLNMMLSSMDKTSAYLTQQFSTKSA